MTNETFNVKSVSFDKRVNIIDHIIANMEERHNGTGQSGILLGGDPGVGKTSFVRDFAVLFGLELIVIETPHLSEEHIINIPFIVYNPVNDTEQKRSDTLPSDGAQEEFEVKLANSNLYAQIKKARKIPDAEFLKGIYNGKRGDLEKVWEALEGDNETIPEKIKEMRNRYTSILFLDEYFRQTSKSIRNMLRGILNGKIGSHEMPDDAYVIYASNLEDEGVEAMSGHEDFRMFNFDAPDKDEWFAYIVGRFEKDKRVKLDMKIVEKFHKILDDKELSNTDVDADVRTSPRRWEELLKYINASLPAKNEDDAKKLMKNVKLNFRNYLTGDKAAISKKVLEAVAELIKETSKLDIKPGEETADHDWRETLKHQLEVKMKLGKHRKYVPVIAGMPGAGKTSYVKHLALELNLVLINVDVETLSAEDAIGLPLAKKGDKGDIDVKFSKPPTYEKIMNDIKKGTTEFENTLRKHFSKEVAAHKIAEFKKSEYKFLIFFDELNRPKDKKVFNAIRRVILEKSFGDGLELPDSAIIVAAINPHGVGIQDFTKHMTDVIDVIPAGVSWSKFKNHLESEDRKLTKLKDDDTPQMVLDTLYNFIDNFKVATASDHHTSKNVDNHFYLDVGSSPMYVSPREYSDIFSYTTRFIDNKLARLRPKMDESDPKQQAELEDKLRGALYESFEHTLNTVLKKNDTQAPEFMANVKDWFMHSDKVGVAGLFSRKIETVDLHQTIDKYFDHEDKDLFKNADFIHYLATVDPVTYTADLVETLVKRIEGDLKNDYAIIRKMTHKQKELDKGHEMTVLTNKEITHLEHFMRELINTIKINKIDGVIYVNTVDAFRTAVGKIDVSDNDELSDAVIEINTKVCDYVKSLGGKTAPPKK
jgi:MoxR-like ATPase